MTDLGQEIEIDLKIMTVPIIISLDTITDPKAVTEADLETDIKTVIEAMNEETDLAADPPPHTLVISIWLIP